MNLMELNEHYKLICDLHNAECMLENLCSLAENGVASVPGSASAFELGDEIEDLQSRIKHYNEIRAHNEPGIREYISRIASDQTRLIFKLRFLEGFMWKEIASIIGGGNSAENMGVTGRAGCVHRARYSASAVSVKNTLPPGHR